MFPYELSPDHAAHIYKKSQPLSVTFTVSKYPSETLGQFLKKLRLEKGLEQRELGQRICVSEVSVYNWENERKVPSKKSMERLAEFFKIRRKTLEDFKMERKVSEMSLY